MDERLSDTPISFSLVMPAQIIFGWGRIAELPLLLPPLGKRAFLQVGSRALEREGVIDRLEESIRAASVDVVRLPTISREPLVEDVDQRVALIRDVGAGPGDMVIAIGGGAAIDLGKAVAGLALDRQGDSVLDYLEGVGKGLSLEGRPTLPFVAVPTTSGTGSEATRNAVISSLDPPFKKSLRATSLMARLVVVDPQLTVSAPPSVTAYSGMDAITQLIESHLSRRATPLTRMLASHGLLDTSKALRRAFKHGDDRAARERMAYAALLSGICLANSGLGMAHGVAAALGVIANVPHGLACAMMLPAALEANRSACASSFIQLGALLTDKPGAHADPNDSIRQLCRDVGVPGQLSAIGVTREMLPQIVKGSAGNSMSGNPRDIPDDELFAILERML